VLALDWTLKHGVGDNLVQSDRNIVNSVVDDDSVSPPMVTVATDALKMCVFKLSDAMFTDTHRHTLAQCIALLLQYQYTDPLPALELAVHRYGDMSAYMPNADTDSTSANGDSAISSITATDEVGGWRECLQPICRAAVEAGYQVQ
jgi:hypothetical protein